MTCVTYFFFFKQKTAYEMRISDWSSDVCSSDLADPAKSARYQPRRATRPNHESRTPVTGRLRGSLGRLYAQLFICHALTFLFGCGCSASNQIGRASCRERVCQYV